jgi:transposase
MSNGVWIGVDVAKVSFHAAIAGSDVRPDEWARLPQGKFDHSCEGMKGFVVWMKEKGINRGTGAGVCLESTGRLSERWVELAGEDLGRICVVNPARPVAYAKSLGLRSKSDRVDACVLALYGQAMRPKTSARLTKSQKALRELSRLHAAVSSDYRAYKQRLEDGPSSGAARASLKKIVAAMSRQLKQLEADMQEVIAKDEGLSRDFRRAKTVTGIGTKTAALILAEFGDLRSYNRDEFVALAGLYPREYYSGTSVHRKPRLAKGGKAVVRAHLYMCAMVAAKYNPALRAFAKRLEGYGKRPMQILGALMRKLLMLVHAVVVSETDYDPNYAARLKSSAA